MDTFLPTGTVVVQVVGCDEDGASLRSDSIMIILADNVDVRQKIFEVNSFAVFASGRLRTQLNGFLALVGKALADVLSFNAANQKKNKSCGERDIFWLDARCTRDCEKCAVGSIGHCFS